MGETAREIKTWITALGLTENHEQDGDDLRPDLRDGALLCRLVNRLKPGIIPKIKHGPESDEERLYNIGLFTKACQQLGLEDEEVFQADDFESEEGYERIVRTLASLENVAASYGLGKQFVEQQQLSPSLTTETDTAQDTSEQLNTPDMSDLKRNSGIHLVKAAFPFSGRDEDELCFGKGDILEITKVVDGGWWEATLNGKTGWFPSNYVREISASPEPTTPVSPHPLSSTKKESARVYHNLVVQNILDTERAHVSELQALLQNYLKPLQTSNVIPEKDLKILCGNFEELVRFQQSMYSILEECAHLPLQQQRMGAAFLKLAPAKKELYVQYCANHPRAVEVLTKYSDDLSAFIENKGAPAPGTLTLTTSLSKPFRHLDRYQTLLKELERHLEEGHVDELDTKKAIAVFQNLATSCHETRKKKDAELEMLTGTIENLEEGDISKLGELQLMTQFLVHGDEDGDKDEDEDDVTERYFLLFPSCLVILSVSANVIGYRFEKKYDLTGSTVRSLEDKEGILNAFEIEVNGDVMKLSTNHSNEKVAWLEGLQRGGQGSKSPSPLPSPHEDKLSTGSPWVERQPALQIARSDSKSSPPQTESGSSPPNSATSKNSTATSGIHSQSSFDPRSVSTSHSVATDLTALSSAPHSPFKRGQWDITRLRPTPPIRPAYALIAKEETSFAHRSMRGLLHPNKKKQGRSKSEVDDDKQSYISGGTSRVLEEDMKILGVIESYCRSAKSRHTLNSSPIMPLVPPRRPWSTSSIKSDTSKTKKSKKKANRDVVGEFLCLRKKVDELQSETASLRQSLLKEQRARKNMESFIRSSLQGVIPNFKWEEMSDKDC